MNTVEQFVTKFHNLEGVTIDEKRRDFFQFLHSQSHLHQNPTILDVIVPQLTVQNHFESLCYIDLLIYFQRHKELSLEFSKGNNIVVSKITKHKWFFEKLFQENTDFVNLYLPSLSYSLRLKVLKKLALILNEDQSDTLFDSLLARYGVFLASNVLTSCSIKKIEQTLSNYPIKLWTNQLKLLYHRKPELMYLYIEERVKHEGDTTFLNYDPILTYIAARNPDMFCILQEKHNLHSFKIGKRSTKRLVRLKKDKIIAKPEVYAQNVNPARFVRTLGKDFHQVYLKLFPKKIDQTFSWCDVANSKLLPHYVKNRRFQLFKDTFGQIFYHPLELALESINNYNCESLLATITDPEERLKWARLKTRDSSCMKFFNSGETWSGVRTKLKHSTLEKQSEYIGVVTESCLINKDWKTLLEVCGQLCQGSRSDDQDVHRRFLKVLSLNKFKYVFDNLTQDHWTFIKQIIVKADEVTAPLTFKYLEFAHKSLPNDVVTFLTKVKWNSCLNTLLSDKTTEKSILTLLIKLTPQIFTSEDIILTDIRLIMACKTYSEHHPGEKISIFEHPRLVESLKKAPNQSEAPPAFEWAICSHQHDGINDLIDIVWDHFEDLATKKLTLWFLKHRPSLVGAHIEIFMDVVFNKFSSDFDWYKQLKLIWRRIKPYSHLELDKMVVEFCVNKLEDDDFEEKSRLVEPLVFLMPAADYLKLVETYKPSSFTVDLTDDVISEKFQLQRHMLKSFVHLNAPQEVLSVIFQFLSGSYVASCISSLYSSLYKYPENAIGATLDLLTKTGAVSVKKHGFYFICVAQPESIILKSIKKCPLSQSIAMAYQHFVKNPSEPSWELVQNKLPKLDNNDHFTSLLLVNTPAPKNYKAQYFEAAYNVFKMKQNRFASVLVDKLTKDVIGRLSNRFFNTVADDFLQMKKSEFVCSCYLLYSGENWKFDVIFQVLRIFKEHKWSLESHEAREKIKKFVITFSTLYMDSEITDPALVTTFAEGFHKIFPPVEVFEEYIILSLILFKSQNKLDLSKSVLGFYNHLISTYGKLVFGIFAACLEKIFDKFFPDECRKFEFYCGLFEFAKTTEELLLIIKLLPREKPQLKKIAANYNKTLDSIRKCDNETVQLHLSRQCR